MTNTLELKNSILDAVNKFNSESFLNSALQLFKTLGYESDRTLHTTTVNEFKQQFDHENKLSSSSAMYEKWLSANLLFQITDEELSANTPLFKNKSVKVSLLQSYVFIAIELTSSDYSRGKLAGITRQINRIFPMPVMVIFKAGDNLSFAVINRRINKKDENKDVLGKVTLIQNINIKNPHTGHIDILSSFALSELCAGKREINSFDQLHEAWEEVFNVELLNKRFYEELSNWYFWARKTVKFPADLQADEQTRNATSVIRLLTRLIFCWFIKEKNLIPNQIFEEDFIKKTLTNLDDSDSSYYRAILQNLFFATLNQPMNSVGNINRKFAADNGVLKSNKSEYGIKTLYRYSEIFKEPDKALSLFENIPFLNGGLFACLDVENANGRVLYEDGFSRNPDKQAYVPNNLFFCEPHIVDLSGTTDFGDSKKKKAKVRGLLNILNGYKFTITENTPVEQEIALDPELLGNVFENLLASYNPETGENARKQTGSFYTPRAIVDHMVDQALKAYLKNELCKHLPSTTLEDAQTGLDILFAYTEKTHAFNDQECESIIKAIDACNILDPACGSGAYPMGILHKLVFVLGKLDPNNERWKRRQISKAEEIEDPQARETAITAIENDFDNNALDYGRKLYLIENCIYGVDIQPIAIQIAKLRFFISLICDQKTNSDKEKNLGVRPLPNLETKFVAADSLISLEKKSITTLSLASSDEIKILQNELSITRHKYFSAQTREQKNKLRKKDSELREQILKSLEALGFGNEEERTRINWNPYEQHNVASFFDPGTMFGPELKNGFDVVIGNPPYVQIQKFPSTQKLEWEKQEYATFTAAGDIYCLFYERGYDLLKVDGQLSYITSNKWMRAGYGEKLRKFFTDNTQIISIMDFGMSQNFSAATTLTCILHLTKRKQTEPTLACYVNNEEQAMRDPSGYFSANAIDRKDFESSPWILLSAERYKIKQLIEKQGVALKNWKIDINYGIKTGYNEAFYISTEQKDAFIAEDPKCAELIVPLLRGRDIDRYSTTWELLDDEKWLINTHNGNRRNNQQPVNVEKDYPVLWNHLKQFKIKLQNRSDQGEHWSNLRNCAYLDEFNKTKIIYPNMTKYIPFYLDKDQHFFGNQKCFIITTLTESLSYLTAVLNSNLFRCCFKDNFPELLGNTYELSKIFMDKIPIKSEASPQKCLR